MARVGPVELTRGSGWEFRVVARRRPGAWSSTLERALAGLAGPVGRVPWPRRWRIFSRRSATWPVQASLPASETELPDAMVLTSLPEALRLGGRRLERADVGAGPVDLAALFGQARIRRSAWLFAPLDLPRPLNLEVHAGADWWMQWFVDGRAVFDTLEQGNRSPLLETAHRFPLTLAAGRHHLAVHVLSGNGGWAFASTATPGRAAALPPCTVEARRVFSVAAPRSHAGLVFQGERDSAVRLNGHRLVAPHPGLHYERLPGLPATLLRRGRNELHRTWTVAESVAGAGLRSLRLFQHSGPARRLAVSGSLFGIPPEAAAISTGPFLGEVTGTTLALSCATEVRCPVRLTCAGCTLTSRPGLLHRFDLDGLQPGTRYRYALRAGRGRTSRHALRTVEAQAPLDLAIYGDPSPQPMVLAKVLAAMQAARPDAALALGDLTGHGCHGDLWNREYGDLAPAFFAGTPHLWVVGNHEEGCPIFTSLFATPGGGANWTTVLRGCRFVGIDGLQDWSAGSANTRWLERILGAARERFIVFADHYPAWSSTPHAALGADGQPWQRTVREARDVILPILARHGVSLFLNGHAHCYERSQPPEGVTCITSGGAGGYLYAAVPDPRTNPHSRRFVPVHHWCRLRISDSALELTAYGLDGRTLDRCRWAPRG